jgi:hypothetical protein
MTDDTDRMRDVDHTHPHGGDATRRLYERGNEGAPERDEAAD